MKFLLDIPLVMALAGWIWGEDPAVTPEFCIGSVPIMNGDCWSRLIAKGLGIAIILGACLNKTPIMLNILNAKSTLGLSGSSVYGEIIMMANGFFYGMLSGFPLTSYGENMALLIQSVAIMLLMWRFADDPKISMQERVLVGLAAVVYVAVVMSLPTEYHSMLMATVWPVMLYSRGSQIWTTIQIQHTGTQSIVTTTMNLVGSSIRILTTIKEVGWDMAVLTGFFISVALNLIMFLQYFYYKSNTEKILKGLQEKKKQ